ncbi:MAG: acyl carrier protein [Euryarchaeota archaeon]|nr:acyl carrier protein [Euryarchaeota archaeon]
MNMEDVIKIVSEYLDVDNVKPESHLVDDLGADEFDTIELIIKVEQSLGIKIPDADSDNVKTVQDLINVVQGNQ